MVVCLFVFKHCSLPDGNPVSLDNKPLPIYVDHDHVLAATRSWRALSLLTTSWQRCFYANISLNYTFFHKSLKDDTLSDLLHLTSQHYLF